MSKSSATLLPQAFLTARRSTYTDVWHQRLGHPSSWILSLLVLNKKVSCTSKQFHFDCQDCLLEKLSRLSLGPMGYKTSAPLELIYSDVWGPSPMLPSDGFWYFVIFVDAYTKYIWFFLLVAKYDVFTIFHQFQTQVEH